MTEGAFLGTGGPTIFLPGTIDNVGGSITANADILNGAVSGVNGSGDLLDVTFQALTAGSSGEQIFNLIALNSFGQGLTETTASSTVTVSGGGVPEPGTGVLLAVGVVGLFAFLDCGHLDLPPPDVRYGYVNLGVKPVFLARIFTAVGPRVTLSW